MPIMAQRPALRKSNEQFKAAKRRFALNGNRAAGAAKQPMDPADQETARAYFANARTYEDPSVLQLYVYYMLSMTFGYRGREVWHQLKKDPFVEGRDELGRPVIRADQALMEKIISTQDPTLHAEELVSCRTTQRQGFTCIQLLSCTCQNWTHVSRRFFRRRKRPRSWNGSQTASPGTWVQTRSTT